MAKNTQSFRFRFYQIKYLTQIPRMNGPNPPPPNQGGLRDFENFQGGGYPLTPLPGNE